MGLFYSDEHGNIASRGGQVLLHRAGRPTHDVLQHWRFAHVTEQQRLLIERAFRHVHNDPSTWEVLHALELAARDELPSLHTCARLKHDIRVGGRDDWRLRALLPARDEYPERVELQHWEYPPDPFYGFRADGVAHRYTRVAHIEIFPATEAFVLIDATKEVHR